MLKCILIIDDDIITGKLYSRIISKMNISERIGSFSYGVHALEFLMTYVPEIVFVDLNMPGMDGFEVIENLNRNENRNKMKVVAMTARLTPDLQNKLINLGVEKQILKPLTEEKILEIL
jgi:CheY-like chemotaxis protein